MEMYNRTCRYYNLVWDHEVMNFVYYAAPDEGDVKLLPVSLSARPTGQQFQAPNQKTRSLAWRPVLRHGRIPENISHANASVAAYYAPMVAPWNFAHTLFGDLFPIFWQLMEHGIDSDDVQVIATSYYQRLFSLPNANKAFPMFSKTPPMYDEAMNTTTQRFPLVVVGSGTKSWAWVTKEYTGSGSSELWRKFRDRAVRLSGATDKPPRRELLASGAKKASELPIRVTLCDKRDKRRMTNVDAIKQALVDAFGTSSGGVLESPVEFQLETVIERSAKGQVQLLIDTDVFVCNEGTLATKFFLMRPGSVLLSLQQVFHGPHLHFLAFADEVFQYDFSQKKIVRGWSKDLPKEPHWWKLPDLVRPDPRKKVGGNIDWFPPLIKWVHVLWYDDIPMNETKIQLPLENLRNLMPEYNTIVQARKLVPLMRDALTFVGGRVPVPVVERRWYEARKESVDGGALGEWRLAKGTGFIEYPRKPEWVREKYGSLSRGGVSAEAPANYGITANLCRQLLTLSPELTSSFNTKHCRYGQNWLCELYANSEFDYRFIHGKWKTSFGTCGNTLKSSPRSQGLYDPRDEWPVEGYRFFNKKTLTGIHNYPLVKNELLSIIFPKKLNPKEERKKQSNE